MVKKLLILQIKYLLRSVILIPNIFIILFFAIWISLFYLRKYYFKFTSPLWIVDSMQFTHNRKTYNPNQHM